MQNEFRQQIATLSTQIAQVASRLSALEAQVARLQTPVQNVVHMTEYKPEAILGNGPVGGAIL